MHNFRSEKHTWTFCRECHGQGTKKRRIRKKVRLQYLKEAELFEKNNSKGEKPIAPKGSLYPCPICNGLGIISSEKPPSPDQKNYPHVAIIGAGIGGVALAVACLHRGIPFTLYERDENFEARSQGYGLTLQQASKAIEALGISNLKEGIISTRHVVHSTDGKIIGEWGMRKWLKSNPVVTKKRTNIHIARQSLRLALLQQLGGTEKVSWGHQLVDFEQNTPDNILNETPNENPNNNNQVKLTFKVDGKLKTEKADLIVGADGIRSAVRKLLIDEKKAPLRYLNCIVILGICPLKAIKNNENELLDSATVFQTANGNERIYMMPFSSNSIMWQLSFPIAEQDAKNLHQQGAQALKMEAVKRTKWHSPIPEIIAATNEEQISGYPVYDRKLLQPEILKNAYNVTLIGDAAHPMSPFKGQGANQALLDALSLARAIAKNCNAFSDWKTIGIRKKILTEFEAAMIKRSNVKVKDSAEAVEILHSIEVLKKNNKPRGSKK